jgi:hypothetical protein
MGYAWKIDTPFNTWPELDFWSGRNATFNFQPVPLRQARAKGRISTRAADRSMLGSFARNATKATKAAPPGRPGTRDQHLICHVVSPRSERLELEKFVHRSGWRLVISHLVEGVV